MVDVSEVKRPGPQREVLRALREAGRPLSSHELAAATGLSIRQVRNACCHLQRERGYSPNVQPALVERVGDVVPALYRAVGSLVEEAKRLYEISDREAKLREGT